MHVKTRAIRISGWVIATVAGLYLLLLFVAGLYINHQKQRIIAYVTAELNQRVRGQFVIKDIDISAWTSFPSIDFRLNGLEITDSLRRLPALSAQTVATSFSLFQIIQGKTSINDVLIENAALHIFTDSTGYTNQYLLQSGTKASSQQEQKVKSNLDISSVRLKNVSIVIEDKVKEKEISFRVNSAHARISDIDSNLLIRLSENITMQKGLGFNLERGAFLENQTLIGNWLLVFNPATKAVAFNHAAVAISQHPFMLDGQFRFGAANPTFRVAFMVKKIPYTLAKSIVSARIRQKLDLVNVLQPIDASGSIEGSLLPAHDPAVNINWETNGNEVLTDGGRFSNCSFAGNFMNSVNGGAPYVDSNSRISFSRLKGDWDGIPFTADSSSITNLDTARLQLHIRSACKLPDLDNKLAMEDIAFTGGLARFDLHYDGPIVNNKSVLQHIQGTMTIENGTVGYTPRGFTFSDCNGVLALFKDSIRMDNFNCRFGGNRFDVALYGNNMRRKFVSGDASKPALLECFVRASFINLDNFNSLFAQAARRDIGKKPSGSFAATARNIDAMLDNSSIGVHVNALAFKHGNLHANNLAAVVRFEPQYWALEQIMMNIAGGTISSSGKVEHVSRNLHNASFRMKVDKVDVSKLLSAFDNFGQEAVTDQELSGSFSTIADLKVGISAQGHIIPASLIGKVDFVLQDGALHNFAPLNNLTPFVFKNRDMRLVRFAELKNQLTIKGENLLLNRMEVQASVFRLFIQGNYGLAKRNTDLLIQVPFSNLNKNSFESEQQPLNKGVESKAGASIWLRAVNGENGKVKVKLTMRKKMKNADATL